MAETPRHGEVWWIDFHPSIGREARKSRLGVIVSNDAANAALNRIQVVPLTSNVTRLYPGEAPITLNGEQRKAAADQLATASKLRPRGSLGALSTLDTIAVDRAGRLHLHLRRSGD